MLNVEMCNVDVKVEPLHHPVGLSQTNRFFQAQVKPTLFQIEEKLPRAAKHGPAHLERGSRGASLLQVIYHFLAKGSFGILILLLLRKDVLLDKTDLWGVSLGVTRIRATS